MIGNQSLHLDIKDIEFNKKFKTILMRWQSAFLTKDKDIEFESSSKNTIMLRGMLTNTFEIIFIELFFF